MPKTIYDAKLTDLLPSNMRNDPKINSIGSAFDAMNSIVVENISKVFVLANIQGLDSDVLDLMATEMHVDYYNQALPLETKRNLVAQSGAIHRIKGTKAAIEKVIKIVFGSAQVQEWFEYGGTKGTFRVLVNEFPNYDSQTDEIKRAIQSTQRLSQHLDQVIIIAPTTTANMYLAGVFQISINITLTQSGG